QPEREFVAWMECLCWGVVSRKVSSPAWDSNQRKGVDACICDIRGTEIVVERRHILLDLRNTVNPVTTAYRYRTIAHIGDVNRLRLRRHHSPRLECAAIELEAFHRNLLV